MDTRNYTITNIHRGKNERRHIIYAILKDEKGEMILSATLDIIHDRLRDMTKELPTE